MSSTIRVQPAASLLRAFAVWATEQQPKVRTASPNSFAVPAGLWPHVPEELLLGALVAGHPYVPRPAEARLLDCGLCFEEDGEEVHPHPECTASGQGVAGPAEAVPGEVLPDLPEQAYAPDAAPLEPVEFAPLEDAPAEEEPVPAAAEAFACTEAGCGRDFTTERGLTSHRNRVHGG